MQVVKVSTKQLDRQGVDDGDRGGTHLGGKWIPLIAASNNNQCVTLVVGWHPMGIGGHKKPGSVAGLG